VAQRFAEIDALKAIGIVTVVLIHSIRSPWDAGVSQLEVWLGHVTRFGVPAFLFASGFLYATRSPVPWATSARRLRRIAVPYLVASALAQVWRALLGATTEVGAGSVWLDLLLGSSFGPYYYVFVIAGLVLVTPVFARCSPAAIAALAGILLLAQWCVDAALVWQLPLYWHLRNPLLWWAFFATGWLARLHLAPLSAWLRAHRRRAAWALAIAVLALSALCGLDAVAPRLWVRSAAWLDLYAILALIYVLASGDGRACRALRTLSDSAYAIYLFHLFFVLAAQTFAPHPWQEISLVSLAAPWAAGLAGPLLLVAGARAALGARARDWIGA